MIVTEISFITFFVNGYHFCDCTALGKNTLNELKLKEVLQVWYNYISNNTQEIRSYVVMT